MTPVSAPDPRHGHPPGPLGFPGGTPPRGAECPKCASREVRAISLVETTDGASLSMPPAPRPWIPWGLVAAAAVILVVGSLPHRRVLAFGAAVGALLASLGAFTALRHNKWTYPAQRERWERSFLCERCGELFVPR